MTLKFLTDKFSDELKSELESRRYFKCSRVRVFDEGWDSIEYTGPSDERMWPILNYCQQVFDLLGIRIVEAWHVISVRIA